MTAGEGTGENQGLTSQSVSSEEPNILFLQPSGRRQESKKERKQKAVVEKE